MEPEPKQLISALAVLQDYVTGWLAGLRGFWWRSDDGGRRDRTRGCSGPAPPWRRRPADSRRGPAGSWAAPPSAGSCPPPPVPAQPTRSVQRGNDGLNSHSCFVSQCCRSGSIIWTLVDPDPEAKGVRLKIKIHHSDTQLTVYIFGSTTLFFLDLKYVQYYQLDTYRSWSLVWKKAMRSFKSFLRASWPWLTGIMKAFFKTTGDLEAKIAKTRIAPTPLNAVTFSGQTQQKNTAREQFFYSFTARGLRFFYIIYTVLQCDLPPLRPHCGEALGRDSNPGRAAI